MNLVGHRILVTGATGFVGRHLTRALVEAGAQVTCLVRASSCTAKLPQGVRTVQACLCTGHGLDQALQGQDTLIHMAALLFGLGWQDYLHSNARAAQCLAQALRTYGGHIRRVVLVSSLAATGPAATGAGVEDDTPPAPVSAYGWSKYMTEQILGAALGQRMVTVRPPIIYGSGDRGLLPYFQAARKGFVVCPGSGHFPVSAVHVHDMVQALLLCLHENAHGIYHLDDGAQHTMPAIGRAIAAALHAGSARPFRAPRIIPVPLWIMGAAAHLAGLWGHVAVRMGRRAPSWNPDKYREACQEGWLCNSKRIARELGYSPTISLEQGMAEAVAGYRQEGWIS
ncbi:MAG: NAD(P)-dependent oxidoreductase [Desulfovibrionaceae bacterium]